MCVVPSIDQLGVDPHFVPGALHAALNNVRYPKLLSDLAQIARDFCLILHYAGAADHFQVRDLGQARQDFILHAVGEKSVGFLLAQIFKGKNRDAFFRNT